MERLTAAPLRPKSAGNRLDVCSSMHDRSSRHAARRLDSDTEEGNLNKAEAELANWQAIARSREYYGIRQRQLFAA